MYRRVVCALVERAVLLFKWFALITVALGAITTSAWAFHGDVGFWLSVVIGWLGLGVLIVFIPLSPFLIGSEWVLERFPPLQRAAKAIAAVAFWVMLLPMICLQPGVRRHPETVLTLIGIISILSVGSYAGVIWWPKRFGKGLMSAQLLVILLLTVLAIKFPNTANALTWRSLWADQRIGAAIAQPIDEKFYDDPDQLAFVNAAGDPTIFGFKAAGIWHLSDRPGFHRSGMELKPIIQQRDRDEIYAMVKAVQIKRLADLAKARSDQLAAEEIKRRLDEARNEAQRLAALEQERKQKREEAEQQIAAEKQEAERRQLAEEQYRLAHVHYNLLNAPASGVRVAVMLVRGPGSVDEQLADALTSSLQSKGILASASFFTSLAGADGAFDRLYDDDVQEIVRLRLKGAVDYLFLGRLTIDTKGPFEDGVINTKVTLDVHLVSIKTGSIADRFSMTEEGVGFSNAKSEAQAWAALTQKLIERKTNLKC